MVLREQGSARLRRLAAVGMVSALTLTAACQTTDSFTRQLGLQPIAADDVCGMHSERLREAKGYFERNIVQGAVIGAVGGAVLGALITGDVGGAVRGGLIGGVAGAGSGYLAARQKEAQDRASLVQTVYQDSSRESAEVVRALSSFNGARNCRLQRVDRIKADFKAGRLSRTDAQSQLDLERQRYNDDIVTVRAIGARIDERHKELVSAAETLAQDNPEAQQLLNEARAAEKEAWSNPNLVTPTTAPAVGYPKRMRAQTNVNVRKQPTVGAARVGLLQGGMGVDALGPDENGWTPVELENGAKGFVASRYLEAGDTVIAAPSTTPAALNPPETTLASLTRSVPETAAVETKTVGVMFEGREKRIELERLAQQAEREERTVFTLDG